MSEITKETLTKEIENILKDADLSKTSTKKVVQALEKNLGVKLADKRKMIDQLVMEYVNSQESDGEDEEEENDSDEDEKPKKKAKAKKGSDSDFDPTEEQNEVIVKVKRSEANKKIKVWAKADDKVKIVYDSDEDEEEEKPAKKKGKKRKADDDEDSDDWGKKNKKAAKGKKAGGGGRKNSGYTRAYKLSPELAELMGKAEMPRHEVVKRVWEIIKERNLYDQSNKQFAICDDDLIKVIGTKRFRTFGMMKYLKTHFRD